MGVRSRHYGAQIMPSRKNKEAVAAFVRPRFGRIPAAVNYSGHGRSRLYELAAEIPGLFRKSGAATVVDFDILDRALDEMPIAKIKPLAKKVSPGKAQRPSEEVVR
jgi:hypothetical protein